MISDFFLNIAALSGSFWYDRFARWILTNPVPSKSGKAYFLLGDQEARTSVEAFRPVQTDTLGIVRHLRDGGIQAEFELVPGNHYQHAIPRLDRALAHLFK